MKEILCVGFPKKFNNRAVICEAGNVIQKLKYSSLRTEII